MVDFGLLPPEINSALMYSGPGAGPMLAAAAAWKALAGDLHTTASAYATLINGLTDGPWQGPSAASMTAAAFPQLAWLSGTAGQADEVAGQAAAAAGAYEAAFAQTVPPLEIAANRTLLTALLATNFLGQNTAAIAATEAQYAEMWAQDAAAMYGYAGTSATASTLTPFRPAAQATNPAGLAGQAAAVGRAVATSTGVNAETLKAIPSTLQSLAGVTNTPPSLTDLNAALNGLGLSFTSDGSGIVVGGVFGDLLEGLTGSSTLDASTPFDAFIRLISPVRLFTTSFKDIQGLSQAILPQAAKAAPEIAKAMEAVEAVPHAIPNAMGSAAAGVGRAMSVGGLSVPSAWAGAAPPPTTPLATLNGLAGAGEPATNAFNGLPLLGGGRGAPVPFAAPKYGFKPTVVAQPPAGG
jgi:PPE-repeat protein